MAGTAKSRADFKKLKPEEVEEMRQDHIVTFKKTMTDIRRALETYGIGDLSLSDLNKEREVLVTSEQSLLEFKIQYQKRRDLPGEAADEAQVEAWYGPLNEMWHQLKVDISKAVEQRRLDDKQAKEAEESDRKKAEIAVQGKKQDEETNGEIMTACHVYKSHLSKARRSLVSGKRLSDTATEDREDMDQLDTAEEQLIKASFVVLEIVKLEQKLGDFDKENSDKDAENRQLEVETLKDEIQLACEDSERKKKLRWDSDEILRKRGQDRADVKKDRVILPEGMKKGDGSRSSSPSRARTSYVKKEPVTLPDFVEATENAAVSAYPIWKKSFEALISEYDDVFKPSLLRKHLGKSQLKIIEGVSDEYIISMRRLDQHYGDVNRLVKIITEEISNFPQFKSQDFMKLVEFAQLLQNSFRKLAKMGREIELSNAYAMRGILNKFDTKTREDWMEFLATKDVVPDEFAVLVKWLEDRKIPLWKKLGSLSDCSQQGKRIQAGMGAVQGGGDSQEKSGCTFCHATDHRSFYCKLKRQQVCDHCNGKGHSKEGCFKLHPHLKKGKEKGSGGAGATPGPGKNTGKGGAKQDGTGAKKQKDPVKLNHKLFRCANCRVRDANHDTATCFYIPKVLGKKPEFRSSLIRENLDCPICLGDHPESSCTAPKTDCGCQKKHNMHKFVCKDSLFSVVVMENIRLEGSETKPSSLLDMMRVRSPYPEMRSTLGVFWDTGATSNFVTYSTAEELKFHGTPVVIYLQTMEGIRERSCTSYNCKLRKEDGELVKFRAYGVDEIFEGVFQFRANAIDDLFPEMSSWTEIHDSLRPEKIDFLMGNCQKSWMPERQQRAIGGGDLWKMVNSFGSCISGTHPSLTDYEGKHTNLSGSVFKCQVIREVVVNDIQKDIHDLEFCGQRVTKEQVDMKYLLDSFNESERLMIANSLACGRCWCNSCPLPGERFSFQGEKDLKHIKSCLNYDDELGRWITSLPWKQGHSAMDLPETEKVAMKTMLATERSLNKNPDWRKSYNGQIQDFLDRGVARVVDKEELDKCKKNGIRLYYLAHLAVDQPGKTTPVRFCIDASRQQLGGPSPNDLLVLGPKSYINNLAGTLLSFRNGQDGAASMSDISKMHQRVKLEYESTMQQLFLWRFCDESKEPVTISIIVNTFGFINANSTATASLHMSAEKVYNHFKKQIEDRSAEFVPVQSSTEQELTQCADSSESVKTVVEGDNGKFDDDQQVDDIFGTDCALTQKLKKKQEENVKKIGEKVEELDLTGVTDKDLIGMWSEALEIVKERSYVDDILASFKSRKRQSIIKIMIDLILAEAGMPHKGWSDAGEGSEDDVKEIGEKDRLEKTLGMYWKIKSDEFTFKINVKLSGKSSKKSHYTVKWTVEELLKNPPHVLTRRMVLSELAKVFDPLGLISPVLLEAKILIRMSWNGQEQNIPLWDDPLPDKQRQRWCGWFVQIHRLEEVVIRRSVVPGEAWEGLPDLVALADGSPVAFGASLYLVYRLLAGGFWSTLLCARSKIAKKLMSTVPRVELNGSLCAERLKNFVLKKTNIKVRKCFQLVDSEVVIHWVSGDKTNLGVYEGHRVSEILATNIKTEDGGLQGWGHIAREYNSADMCTRPTNVDLVKSGFWLSGPKFLSENPVEDWPVNWHVYKASPKTIELKEKIDRDYNIDFEMMYGVRDMVSIYDNSSRTVTRDTDTNWYKYTRVLELIEKHSDLRTVFRSLAWVNIILPRLAMINREHKDRRILRGKRHSPVNWKDLKVEHRVLSKEDWQLAKRLTIRAVQQEFSVDMEKELNRDQVLKKKGKFKYKKTRYSKLSVFKDDNDIYRVGSRLRMVATVTENGNMPILIPEKSRYHHLQMKLSHERCHWGEKGTKLKFRMDGFWALNSTEVARKIIKDCSFCGGENPRFLVQKMGDFKPEVLQSTEPWSYCELDLFGPYKCKEGRTVVKRWGLLLIDVVSSASYVDIIEDYSAASVVMSLQRFESYFGWPRVISSDPGTQLESAGGKLTEWWKEFGKDLLKLAGKNDFDWNISPAKSPWYQGRVERSIAVIKRLLRSSIGDRQLSTLSLQTALRVCVGVMNTRPLNLDCEVDKKGEYKIVTPNDLLLAKNTRCFDVSKQSDRFKDSQVSRNLEMIKQVQAKFYKDISTYVHPKMILRSKWHYSTEEMPEPGDVVRIHEFNNFGKGWKIAVVKEIRPSKDGKTRSFELEYVILRDGKKPRRVQVSRSGQKLSLLAKGNLLSDPVEVHEGEDDTVVVPVTLSIDHRQDRADVKLS